MAFELKKRSFIASRTNKPGEKSVDFQVSPVRATVRVDPRLSVPLDQEGQQIDREQAAEMPGEVQSIVDQQRGAGFE